jgi:UDP-N-acetylglucosamine transferase subunit ALG13
MIFVSVGTNEARFDRLLQLVTSLEVDDDLLIQYGHSSPVEAPGIELIDFLPFEAMGEKIRAARAFVTHAGVGSIMVALANGRRPIVVPRRQTLGEAVDDHQSQLGRRFAEAGLVTLAETREALVAALEGAQPAAAVVPATSSLASELQLFLEQTIVAPVPA